MERIGDFSKRCQVTIKTLRYYNKIGLLVPDYVDNFTGYRYYGPEKVAEMQRITELKNIGFTLEEIKQYCNAVSNDARNKLIEEKHWSLMKLVEDTALQLEKLEAIKLNLQRGEKKMSIDINTPFENDERIIGRWEIIATVDKKEYFKPGNEYDNKTIYEELYFLPDGEEYWGFSWTKGYIKISFGDGLLVPYELDEVDGQTFMFVDHPSYSGTWVLKQMDNERHTVSSIALNDDIDLPFVDDPQIHGQWRSISYVENIEDFDPEKKSTRIVILHMRAIEFFPDGVLEWTWNNKFKHRWTKGTAMISYWTNGKQTHTTAPAYEIRVINDTEYLFFEHKSGDYTWGKRKPGYYVLKRGALESESESGAHFDMPFENDETVVGHWEIIATVDKREDFVLGQTNDNNSWCKEIYFLPEGNWYWVFSWTKGYIKNNAKLIPYTLENIDDERYMFADWDSENKNVLSTGGLHVYSQSIKKPVWVLRQIDNKSYTSYDIAQWDNIDFPFVDDPSVYGKWTITDWADDIDMFDPEKPNYGDTSFLWVQMLEFLLGGRARKWYQRYNYSEYHTVTWTKGKLLEHFGEGTIAPSYEIREINGKDYLFFQCKNGDYVWGKRRPGYFVFKRG